MLPPPDSWTDQLTAVDWPVVVPETVAVKLSDPPVRVEALDGTMATATTGASSTTTVAVSNAEGTATLVAMTWKVPVCGGAT